MSMFQSFPAKSIRENLAYKIFSLLENGLEGGLALRGLNTGRGLAWHAPWHLPHWWFLPLTAASSGSSSPTLILFFHFTGSYNSQLWDTNLNNQSCGQRGRPGCPGTMWGPASDKFCTHHPVLAGYCRYTQVTSVMDVRFGTRWGLRANKGGDTPACPCWPLSQSPPQWCWEIFPGAPSPVPGGCAHSRPAGCTQAAQLCPAVPTAMGWRWGLELPTPHGAQRCLHPAPCHSVSWSSLRGLREGFGSQAENSCVFNHRWKEHTKLPSPERPLPASRLVCSCWDTSCLIRSVTLC